MLLTDCLTFTDDAMTSLDSVIAVLDKVPVFFDTDPTCDERRSSEKVKRAFERLRRSAVRVLEASASTDPQEISHIWLSAVKRVLEKISQIFEAIIGIVSLIRNQSIRTCSPDF